MPVTILPQNLWMSRSPLPSGRPQITLGQGSGIAYFVDENGNRIDSIECGKSYDFRVDGYPSVYLRQTKDGALQYDGMITLPMGYYTSSCWSDPGVYHGEVYDPFTGVLLTEYDFTVTGSAISALGGSTALLIGGGALLLFLGRKKLGF